MQIKPTIFDSTSERQLFESIAGAWEPSYHLFPHIPYSNLVELDPQCFDVSEISFLHKTTVDYVLTSDKFEPLLGIEFDGLGHGFSRRGTYIPGRAVRQDPQRGWKLNLKCRVAEDSLFPFVVISYDEKATVEETTNLTVAHGIVGAFIAASHVGPRLQEAAREIQTKEPDLTEAEFQERVQDALIAIEIDTDVQFNPVVRREIDFEGELYRRFPGARLSWGYKEDPERPPNAFPWKTGFSQDAFATWWNSVRRFGVEVSIEVDETKHFSTTWVRNYSARGLTPFGWLDELAKLVAIGSFLSEQHLPLPPAV